MTRPTANDRRLHIHSHFAWAAAFWGSARVAQQDANYLLAPIGFYYSAFHAGFAAACTNLDIANESLKQVHHSQLTNYLESILPLEAMLSYAYLQDIREGINYLGAESAERKAQIVRGSEFGFGSTPYFECIERCREHSVKFLRHAQQTIADFAQKNSINYPDLNSDWWIQEFLDDDVLRCVIPREKDGLRALDLAFRSELPALLKTTDQARDAAC